MKSYLNHTAATRPTAFRSAGAGPARAEHASSALKPVFIFGCDRSGTTFLGSLLGSHSRCVTTLESQFVYQSYRAAHVAGVFDLGRALAALKRSFRFRLWNLELDPGEAQHRGVDSYAKLVQFIVRTHADAVGRSSASVWIDHTPHNREHAAYLLQLFPEAKFVHIVRDGRAVAASFKTLPWGTHGTAGISRYWTEKVGQGLATESYLGADRCVRIRYEDLVTDPEGVLKELSPSLGLEFEPQMTTGGGFEPPALTGSYHALVGKPADPTRISAWEHKLTSRDVEVFEASSGGMLACLGYPLKFGVYARGQTGGERYRERLLDLLYYRQRDGFKKRRQHKRTLEQLAAEGYLNRQPVLETPVPEIPVLQNRVEVPPTIRQSRPGNAYSGSRPNDRKLNPTSEGGSRSRDRSP